jgi:hypothetical protein
MSAERTESQWIVDTLKEFFDSKIAYERQISDERDHRYEDRFNSQENAVVVALASINRRLDLLNESRQTIADMIATSPSRAEVKTSFAAIETELKHINTRLDLGEGTHAGRGSMWGWVVGAIGLVALISSLILDFVTKLK